MQKQPKLNLISVAITLITLIYIRLVLTDNELSWYVPEFILFCVPLFFVATFILAIISVRIKRNALAIIIIIISSIAFLITLLGVFYLYELGTKWHN